MNEVDWKTYTDQRFDDADKAVQAALVSQEKAVAAALAAAEKAVSKAELSSDKEFEAANNVKATFSGDLNKKLDRNEYATNHKALQKQIDALTKLVYVGLGAVLALQLVLQFIKK